MLPGRLAVLLLCLQTAPEERARIAYPPREALEYRVEWRLITAGRAKLEWAPKASSEQTAAQANLLLESLGLVSKLYKVNDEYSVEVEDRFCAAVTHIRANEGRRRREASATFDRAARRASYLERDLAKNTVVDTKEFDTPPCVHDIVSGLYRLRALRVEPGQTVELPMTDGKKVVTAKIEAQQREPVRIAKREYKTIRYEAFLFNDVLYRRKGRLFIWLTDDERRLPVQIRVRLQFPIGTITLQLEKEEKP